MTRAPLTTLLLLLSCRSGFDAPAPTDARRDRTLPDGLRNDVSPPDAPVLDHTGEEAGACQLCGWSRRRRLGFNNAMTEALADFPVLVVLDSSRVDYGATQAAGQDLRFVDADGTTVLPHEIEQWNAAGKSYLWVKVPRIDAASVTDHIWLYYGNPTATDGQDAGKVWSPAYRAVWHLGQDPAQGPVKDSTANANHGTATGSMTSSHSVDGKIGQALRFTSPTTFVQVPISPSLNGIQGSAVTVEAWVKFDSFPASNDDAAIVEVEGGHFMLGVEGPGNDAGRFRVNTSVGVATAHTNTSAFVAGAWHHCVGTYDGKAVRLYLQGLHAATASQTGTVAMPVTPLHIGHRTAYNSYIAGTIDEVRVSAVARSPAWIAAQHASQQDVFVSYGPEETLP